MTWKSLGTHHFNKLTLIVFLCFVCSVAKCAGFSSDEDLPAPRHKKRTYMNQPHLCFEITSDDGFSVQASSIEGKRLFHSLPQAERSAEITL